MEQKKRQNPKWWPLTSAQMAWALGVMFLCSCLVAAHYIICESDVFCEVDPRSPVGTAQADMRSIQIAIESYYVDCTAYPAWTTGKDGANADHVLCPAYDQPTFMIRTPERPGLYTLTTPIQYMSTYPHDRFSLAGASYAYSTCGSHDQSWILYSPGPDGIYEIVPREDYDPAKPVPSPSLINKTYDPTNGGMSAGDIYKYKN